jgi:hypothetical protein
MQIMGDAPAALNSWHSAYLEIVNARQKAQFLSFLISSNPLNAAFFHRVVLLFNIVSRNTMSRIRGKFVKRICKFSTKDFEEFRSSF